MQGARFPRDRGKRAKTDLPWLSRFLMNKLYGQSGWWKLLLDRAISYEVTNKTALLLLCTLSRVSTSTGTKSPVQSESSCAFTFDGRVGYIEHSMLQKQCLPYVSCIIREIKMPKLQNCRFLVFLVFTTPEQSPLLTLCVPRSARRKN